MITNLTISNIVSNNWKDDKVETIIVAIEELAELQKELTKVLRGIGKKKHLIEELTDSLIMLQALQLIFNIDDIDIKVINTLKQERTINVIIDKKVNEIFNNL